MSPRLSSALFLVIPIDRAATSYHLLDFNLAALPTVLYLLARWEFGFRITHREARIRRVHGWLSTLIPPLQKYLWSCVPDVMRSTDFAFQ